MSYFYLWFDWETLVKGAGNVSSIFVRVTMRRISHPTFKLFNDFFAFYASLFVQDFHLFKASFELSKILFSNELVMGEYAKSQKANTFFQFEDL